MPERLNVTVLPDGPLKVSNVRNATFCGNHIEVTGDMYLCRCGSSTNAPFCDGTHGKEGFNGTSDAKEAKEVRVWEGQTLRTFFNPNACMHVFYCKPLNELRERELAGDSSAAAEIMRVIGTCPSGALSYETKAAVAEPAAVEGVDIEIMEGGEVRVSCGFDINAPRFERQVEDRATLCRCGMSKNKPWCDGRHKGRKGFR